MTYPRCLVVAEAESQASIVETHAGIGSGKYFVNAVTEFSLGDNARLDHYKIEREGEAGYHVATRQARQGRNSNLSSHALTFDGALVRNDIKSVLDGEGAHCTLNGLFVPRGTQHVDNHLRVDHAKPHCTSWEYFKGVLNDKASGAFCGRIIVREGAQKTDAKQTNQNLLLSPDASIDTRPQLEIFADDVKCTHGATIGEIDENAIFYLRSRGIAEDAARSLMVFAFASECLAEVRVEPLRRQLSELIFDRLPHGDLIREEL